MLTWLESFVHGLAKRLKGRTRTMFSADLTWFLKNTSIQ